MLTNLILAVQKFLLAIVGTVVFGAGATTLDCPSSYQQYLWDTPSGNLDAGYYNASTTPAKDFISSTSGPDRIAPKNPAHVIGLQSFANCTDGTDKYLLNISNTDYTGQAKGGSGLLKETRDTTQLSTAKVN